ncbi:hypothetical protein Hanom_Chr03g00204161 [Helianthus anomalus]
MHKKAKYEGGPPRWFTVKADGDDGDTIVSGGGCGGSDGFRFYNHDLWRTKYQLTVDDSSIRIYISDWVCCLLCYDCLIED